MSLLENSLRSSDNNLDILYSLCLNVKEKDDLLHISYNRNKSDMNNNLVKECRGIIYDKVDNKVISMSLKCKNTLEEFIENVAWKNCVIEESIDGTLINLYYHNNEWKICTKKTFDAKCRWCSDTSFNELFWEALKLETKFNMETLATNYCYSFILCDSRIRNVTKYVETYLYHISSIDITNFKEYDIDIGIIKPKLLKLDKFNSINCNGYNELLVKLDTFDYSKEGVMLYSKDRLYRTKIISKEYLKVKNIKGNYPIIDLRLVELRNDEENLLIFLQYFPEYKEKLETIEKNIKNLEKLILRYYTLIKKQKKQIDIPILLKKIIYELHGEYIKLISCYNQNPNKDKPSINLLNVSDLLKNIKPRRLCMLLNWYNTL
jgi:hypothetical protein